MPCLAFTQFTSLASAIGLGLGTSTAATYSAGVSYTTSARVIGSDGFSYAAKQSIGATSGVSPPNVQYWVRVDPTSGIPVGCRYVKVQAEAKAIRYRPDGISPTAGIGVVISETSFVQREFSLGQSGMVDVSKLSDIQIIESASAAKANVEYWG